MLEMLATVGGLGIVMSISIIVISPLIADVRKVKLDSDVASLNQAINSYITEGGDISAATTPLYRRAPGFVKKRGEVIQLVCFTVGGQDDPPRTH